MRNLHEQVVQELGRLIVGGEIAQGENLPREELLAKRMKVSRTVLREAMKVLSAKGLVESRQGTGARVRDAAHWNQLDPEVLAWRCVSVPGGDFIEKLVEMYEVIGLAAAAAAARRRDDEQLDRIEAACAAMDTAADPDALARAGQACHEAVLHAAHNELMASLFSVLGSTLGELSASAASNGGERGYPPPHHRKLLDAIRRRQPEAARRAMQEMVAGSRGDVRRRA